MDVESPPDEATRSAVVALIGEAEPAVGAHRRRLDPTAPLGLGAHVTVLYPFVAPAALDGPVLARLRAAVADVAAFRCRFAEVGWFGADLMWLAPEPSAPFAELTERVARAFPQHPPYAGEHEPHPHLSVGYGRLAGPDVLRAAAAELAPALPVEAAVTELHVVAGSRAPDSWRTVATVPLAAG